MAQLNFRMPTIRSAAGAMAIALIATSVVAALLGIQGFVALVPARVLSGFVWQLVTYAFVEVSPLGVIFGGLILWSLGGMLEATWGRKRFLWFSFGVATLAAVTTTLLALVLPDFVQGIYPGGNVLTGSMWVAYGLHIGRGQTNFWGLPVSGNALAGIGAGFILLSAVLSGSPAQGFSRVLPELFGLIFTFLYMRDLRPSMWWLRLRSWQLDRDLKRRASHLRGIDGGRRNMPDDSDKYLH